MGTPVNTVNSSLLAKHGRVIGQMVRWMGCSKAEDCFDATPAGAVLLSAVYGRGRGGLRLCTRCGSFIAISLKGYTRRYCKSCAEISKAQSGLPWSRRVRWEKVEARMRKRYLRGRMDDEDWLAWKKTARLALNQAKTAEEFDAWERDFASKMKPGRPRKESHKKN